MVGLAVVIERLRSRRFVKKGAIWLSVFLFLFTVIGFFVLPPIIKSVLVKKLSASLRREVSVGKIKVNPYVLTVDVADLVIKEHSGTKTFVSLGNIHVNMESISIIKGGPVLSEVRLEKPYMNVLRNEDGSYNFSDLIKEEKPKKETPSKPFRFSFNNIMIRGGSIDFFDGPKNTTHTVKDLNLNIPFLSNLPYFIETYVQPSLEASVNGHVVSFKGRTKPFADSLETSFDINIKALDIPHYLAYVPFPMKFVIQSGYIEAAATVAFTQYRNRKPSIVVAGNMTLNKFVLDDKKQNPILRLPHLAVALAASDVMTGNIHFSKISFDSPEVTVSRSQSGDTNLAALAPEAGPEAGKAEARKSEGGKEKTGQFQFNVDELGIKNGRVIFSDMPEGKPFKTTLDAIDLLVEHFSTEKDKKSRLTLSLKTEAEETLEMKGSFSVVPAAAEGTVAAKKVILKRYAPYYSNAVLFSVDEGNLDLTTGFTAAKGEKDFATNLSSLEAAVSSLRLRRLDDKEDFLKVPLLKVQNASVDLGNRKVTVGGLSSDKGFVMVKRLADGTLNLQTLTPSAPGSEPISKGTSRPTVPPAKSGEAPWVITLEALALDRYSMHFDDLATPDPASVSLERIKIRGKNISTEKGSKGRASFSCLLNKKGTISTEGAVSITPPSADLKVSVKDAEIMPFQPYFADKIKIVIAEGSVSADGAVKMSIDKNAGLTASYRGKASCVRFHSMDKVNFEDFLKWQSLDFDGVAFSYNPSSLTITEIALNDFYSRIVINQDGSLNVQGIIEQEAQKEDTVPGNVASPPQASAAVPHDIAQKNPTKIETITFRSGTINFSDHHIQPNYSANLMEIEGKVTGLSSEESKFGDVSLKGKLDNSAPLEITGKINPLRDDLFVDLSANFKDMDLSPVTPYSGKFAGYTIQKGKLSVELKYLIVNKKLDAQNKVFLDQFTLGDRVESPTATRLPVKLAIALLKNRKGEINLDIPVSGYINDPKFSIGGIIIKIILNLLAKAATSPFALLGAIFGGGEELSYIDFDYGFSAINTEGVKKIETIVKALADRPGLKIDIEGHVDIEKDKEGLKQYIFQKKLKAQKLKALVKKGSQAVPIDEVTIDQNEYPVYLKMAYKDEKFTKPRNIIGIAKTLPVPEMEKLMLTHIEVKDDDLRKLASERALKVREHILKSKQVEPERVFLVEPKTLQPEKKEKLKDSRVDFRLK